MAIVFDFTKEPIAFPSGAIYPAYNDSYLEFTDTTAPEDMVKAEIQINPTSIFAKAFVVYPDTNGIFLFNLKEAIKVIFNVNGFTDQNVFTDAYYKQIDGLYHSLSMQITMYSSSENNSAYKSYSFYRAVKQIGEDISENESEILMYSEDFEDYYCTYFEGFPFAFDLKRVGQNTRFRLGYFTGGEWEYYPSNSQIPIGESSLRWNVDKGGTSNVSSDGIFNGQPLKEGLNKLHVQANPTYNQYLWLSLKKQCSGIYLKWINRSGGYSFYLFDKFYNQNIKGSNIGTVLNSELDNIQQLTGNTQSIGKEASSKIIAKARFEAFDYENLKDIFSSPSVQMYTSREAYVSGTFIDVNVNGALSFNNKRGKNEINVVIDLPEMQTIKF